MASGCERGGRRVGHVQLHDGARRERVAGAHDGHAVAGHPAVGDEPLDMGAGEPRGIGHEPVGTAAGDPLSGTWTRTTVLTAALRSCHGSLVVSARRRPPAGRGPQQARCR